MTAIERGKIKGKSIIFPKNLGYPDGTEVYVRVETVEDAERSQREAGEAFSNLAFFGMWADRTDMRDGAAWVREERVKWETRSDRQD